MSNPLFSETQKFKQWWVFFPLILINGLMIWAIYVQIICKIPWGNKPAPDIVIYMAEAVVVLITLLLFSIRLKTEIKEDGIYYQFSPLQFSLRKKAWADIEKCYVRQYRPVAEYGGWGMRMGIFGAGRAINVKGNMGIQLVMKSGKKLLIGTQKAEEAEKVLKQMGKWME
ncbi:MAG TPA: DUF6141 family protein [Bacteroidia bacterium]|jgi:hypothetical protein|nr:DUF6141 family protein [Bacteroidia bacterium]